MSFRTKVLGLVDVLMRVPPILVIDEILKIGFGPLSSSDKITNSSDISSSSAAAVITNSSSEHIHGIINSTANLSENLVNAAAEALSVASGGGSVVENLGSSEDSEFYKILSITTLKFLFCLIGLVSSGCIFMLWTRHLVIVYMFLASVGLIFLSYWSNVSALALMDNGTYLIEDLLSLNMNRLLDPGGVAISILPHLVAQWFMGYLFAYMHLGPRHHLIQKSLPIIFLSPILLAMLPFPMTILKHVPAFAAVIPFLLTKFALWTSAMDVFKTILNGYQYARNFVTNFGLSALIENEWQRLNVPCVLRVFWTIRIGEEFLSMLVSSETPLMVLSTMQKLLVDGCETLTAVLGMTSIISIICHYIGKLFQMFLLAEDSDEEKSLGTVSAVLFYILALQTGLTSLSPDKRFIRLCRNLCLLVTALLHFLHNIVSPILMSLSAARNPSKKRHARALIVCAFLLTVPSVLLFVLWSRHPPSTWSLAVTAFSVEVIVKVLVSLATYVLFLLDARRQNFWEKLDDYVYYIRAFGNTVEFCFGILLFFNGAWILLFESAQNAAGGAIRAIMMCIHAYFNIWCEAKAGWSVFMKRRTAVHKISSLPEATPEQLANFDDVCAICYQEMISAKITKCKHFFHGVCLRKWLYVQDRCPLCHEIMMYIDNKPEDKLNAERPEEHDEGNVNQEQPLPQPSTLFNQFSGVSNVDEDSSSSGSTTRSPPRIQGIGIPSTSGAALHFRMSPAGGGEIQE